MLPTHPQIVQQVHSAALGLAFAHLSNALLATHEIDGAINCACKSVPLSVADGMLWTRLDALALLALRRGRLPEAARIAGRSSALDQRRSSRREPNAQRARDEVMAALQGAFAEEELARLLSEGANLSDEEAANLQVAT